MVTVHLFKNRLEEQCLGSIKLSHNILGFSFPLMDRLSSEYGKQVIYFLNPTATFVNFTHYNLSMFLV